MPGSLDRIRGNELESLRKHFQSLVDKGDRAASRCSPGKKKRTPRFLPTLGHPCTVAFPFIRCGQLMEGLSPPRSRPCRAHPYNSGLNPGVLRLFLIKNGRKWTELDSHSADPPDRQLFIRIADYPIFRYNDFHGHYRTNRRSRTANITSLRQKKIGT